MYRYPPLVRAGTPRLWRALRKRGVTLWGGGGHALGRAGEGIDAGQARGGRMLLRIVVCAAKMWKMWKMWNLTRAQTCLRARPQRARRARARRGGGTATRLLETQETH